MGRVRSFRDDPILEQKLNALNRNEMGRLIRALLYNYFFGMRGNGSLHSMTR